MSTRSNSIFDAVIIGAGHNGPDRCGVSRPRRMLELVLERRDIGGGCCVTEQIAPGCRASTSAYIASMLRPESWVEERCTRKMLRIERTRASYQGLASAMPKALRIRRPL